MREISQREDIIITKANKSGAVVMANVRDYIKEAERQINKTQNYSKLPENPKATGQGLLNYTIE